MKLNYIKVDGVGVDIDTDHRSVEISIHSNMRESHVRTILADLCGEYGIADDVTNENPTLIRKLQQAFNAASDHLGVIERIIAPEIKKAVRVIDNFDPEI